MKPAEKPDNEQQRLKRLKELNVLDTPIEERFDRITRIVCRTLNVPISAISLVDDDRQWFKSAQGLDASETPRDMAFCAHAILDEGPFIVSDASTDPRFEDNPLVTSGPGIRFYAGCPIDLGDGVRIGTLCAIDDKPRSISEDDIRSLRDLTEMVRSELQAITLSDAHQQLTEDLAEAERASLIDPLSRLWNRKGFDNLLERELEFNTRKQSSMGLLLVDIDHFKRVNDTHGHDAGDQVIRSFSSELQQALRPYDTVARWGGEEFVIVLPGCDRDELKQTVNRLLEAIRNASIDYQGSAIKVTASIGGVWIRHDDPGKADDFFKLADHAMYQAKKAGRDQAVFAGA